jgi:hypothetical protein
MFSLNSFLENDDKSDKIKDKISRSNIFLRVQSIAKERTYELNSKFDKTSNFFQNLITI